ncbi:MAG: cell division transport system ATP-binding protein [Clostridiales bacterium]|nr:cell division transport system ATP-binding protein [Clostridiales bacterium]
MIEIKGAQLIYSSGAVALEAIDLTIKPGMLVFITGESGSGKTSLLKLMMGIEKPTQGKVYVDGSDMADLHGNALAKVRRKIGPVFQELKLLEGKTALENVIFGMRFYGMRLETIRKKSSEALAQVGLQIKADMPIETLSWGERQRVAIARAIARKPAYIIADEPTGSLDEANAIKILSLLAELQTPETAVIITTHATHLIKAMAPFNHVSLAGGRMIALSDEFHDGKQGETTKG